MNNRTITYLTKILSTTIEFLANILLPKEKRVKILEALGPAGLFENIPRAENFDLSTAKNQQGKSETNAIKAIFNYKTALCRQAIWEIKYRANKKLIRDFSLLLYEYILEEISDLKTFNNFREIILLPIPSTKAREREKGFNQCVLITRELIKIDKERNGNNFNLLENFLIKKTNTEHQARVSNRKKRLANLKNTFSINENIFRNYSLRLTEYLIAPGTISKNIQPGFGKLSDFSFIIIDDVITTGATMNEAFRILKSIGISRRKIRGYALAH